MPIAHFRANSYALHAMDRHIKSRLTATFLGILLGSSRIAHGDLKSDIDAVLSDKYLQNVEVGVKIVRLTDNNPDTVYERASRTPLKPASNLKVVTTAAALTKFGAGFKFETILAQKDRNLAIIGSGDPAFGDAELLKPFNWTTTTVLENWAASLKKINITAVDHLYIDDSIFDETFTHPTWPDDQLHKRYVAGVAGLNLNANCIDFYLKPQGLGNVVQYVTDPPTSSEGIINNCVLGTKNEVWASRHLQTNKIILRGETNGANVAPISVTVGDPSLFAGNVAGEIFSKAGVKVLNPVLRNRTIRDNVQDGWKPLAIHETPILQILTRANKDSMNLYAEALCKRLGNADSGKSGSWENGTAAIGKYLQSIGVPPDQFKLIDGCGLSHSNTISPDAIVSVLVSEFNKSTRDAYISTLAIAAVDGTLKDRFESSPMRGRVFGKSGFIDGVSCLSGYLKNKDGHWFAFSIMFNGIPKKSNSVAKPLQERILRAVDLSQ